ncbi:uncharacterized protein DDB_G0292642-like [Cyprinodon tularosa]|uniref:uncharacterized protein DDB_G0292642-like n=1 Tax=Cyprinodon tularosa TaxID=77115 RepID=UPI0018E280ED|nr:uncharacterized protein DDB_G0292642-like [Cyprinodon tularosa]
MNIQEQDSPAKQYDPLDQTLKFVNREDEVVPGSSDSSSLRAEMSCGHAVTPDSLTIWCKNLLKQGQNKFRCPAVVEGTKQCNKLWSYQEVRRLADLNVDEMLYFEQEMANLSVSEYCEVQSCPKCKTSVEREDPSNLCVQCVVCTADQKEIYQFCWQCLRDWKGPGPRSDRCDNADCINRDLQLLQTCKFISLPDVVGVSSCPSVRACPVCGAKVEHDQKYCKNVTCPRCQTTFCFVCLKLKTECIKTSSPYEMCRSGVAPRQTYIPVWRK